MKTTAEEMEKYLQETTKELEKSLEKTGKTSRQIRRKGRQRIKHFVTSTNGLKK